MTIGRAVLNGRKGRWLALGLLVIAASCATRVDPPQIEVEQAVIQPDQQLFLCPRMTVSNAPSHDAETRQVAGYRPFTKVNDKVYLMTAPVKGACLSSAFGYRGAKLHKGLDFHSRPAVPIYAAGHGTVVERSFRSGDFGNMIVVDHGHGVYTRYAHLASVSDCIQEGATVQPGSELGMMGATGAAARAVHLHYEVLLGDLAKAGSSFLLDPIDPFTLDGADGMVLSASVPAGNACS